MSEPFIAQVQIFPYNFAPRGWANCDGQLLPIAQNTALFALIGTVYGGDGRTTFGLPNLKGRGVIHPGNGPGLSPYNLAQRGGVEKVTLIESQMAGHTHNLQGSTDEAEFDGSPNPSGNVTGVVEGGADVYAAANNLQALASSAVENTGGGGPHNNMLPFLTLRFCTALQGIFPSRS